jgi:hypothetical protein
MVSVRCRGRWFARMMLAGAFVVGTGPAQAQSYNGYYRYPPYSGYSPGYSAPPASYGYGNPAAGFGLGTVSRDGGYGDRGFGPRVRGSNQ